MMIELKNMNIQLNDFQLQKINIHVKNNESMVFVGPSGQGKSVLLKIMAGIIKPDEGEVLINHHNLHTVSEKIKNEIIYNVGMLFQKNALFDSMTVGENIAFPLMEVRHLNKLQANTIVDHYLEAVGISHAKNLFPDEISGGMQKRLGIARALALSPKIVFYDDPTAGLDPITSRKIIELILKMKKQQKSTLVTVTNDMNRAFELADRMAMIVDGEVIVTGTVDETKKHSDPRVQQFIQGQLEGPLTEQLV